jgi:hypothetical protein
VSGTAASDQAERRRELAAATGHGANFTLSLPFDVATGQFLAATATDPNGNTSIFSMPVVVS